VLYAAASALDDTARDEAARRHGAIRGQVRHEGRLIGANDLWIAATAWAAEVTLVTRNPKELQRVPGLAVAAWCAAALGLRHPSSDDGARDFRIAVVPTGAEA